MVLDVSPVENRMRLQEPPPADGGPEHIVLVPERPDPVLDVFDGRGHRVGFLGLGICLATRPRVGALYVLRPGILIVGGR